MSWGMVARAQAGVISRAQLRAAGLDDDRIDTLISSGAIEALWRGVFLVRGAPFTYEVGLWSAVLSFGGVLGFATAAHLWGMVDRPDIIEVIVPRRLHLWRQSGVRTHRIDLRPWAVTVRHGLPVTTRRETALDHIGRMPSGKAFPFADRALQQGWLLPRDFEDRVRRQPGRIGNTRMRLLATTAGDGAAAHSERVLHGLLRRAGLAGWVPNHDIWLGGELAGVVDVAFTAARLAIEIDGMAWHVGADRFQRDRTKQNALVGAGWTVLRFTWSDLVDRPGYVIATIRRHLANSGSVPA
jgi:very-short-patch-repair endonuclease